MAAVLEAGRQVRIHADALADVFATLIRTHVLSDVLARASAGEAPGPHEADRIAETFEKLRPLTKGVVEAELSMAVDRRVRAELAQWLREQGQEGT